MTIRQLMLSDYRIRQRDYLLEIVRALTRNLDQDEVLRRILAAAADMLSARSGLIVLQDDLNPATLTGDGAMRVHAYFQCRAELLQDFNEVLQQLHADGPHDDVVAEMLRRIRALEPERGYNLPAAVGLPLKVADKLIGALLVFRTSATAFDVNERQILQSFADQAAIAVHNARLYEHAVSEQRRLDAILDGSADGVLIMDASHVIQRWNRALTRLTDIEPAQATGKPHDSVLRWAMRRPGPDLKEAAANGWPLASQSVLYVEGDLLRADGSTVAVGVTYAPIYGDRGQLVNVVANVRDITQFREAEQMKSTFISVISHELRTPVSLIKGYASTLRRPDAPWAKEIVQESLEIIEEEADRLTALIENLLEASRLQAGGILLEQDEFSPKALAQDVVNKLQVQADGTHLHTDFPDHFPVVIGDEERLRQVFINLVTNAFKYAPGSDVVVGGTVQPRMVTLYVRDHGSGIPPNELERVFDRFHRAKTPATERAQGAGLGLYLSRAIVMAHGGQIWVESQPGQGTTFCFTLPRPAARLASPDDDDDTIPPVGRQVRSTDER